MNRVIGEVRERERETDTYKECNNRNKQNIHNVTNKLN